MYRDTITLFNRYKSDAGDVWYPTILRNVNLNLDKAAIIAKYGTESQDKAILNIRYHIADGNKMVGDKIWLPPKTWSGQGIDSLPSSITFKSGQDFDFFWIGEWKGEEPISDDAHGIDGFYDYMDNRHDYVFAVSSVSMYSAIPHFEITGK